MLKYLDYEMLIELYRSESITTASKRLFITQPALTKWIHRLESDLGVILVKRNTKGVEFTPEGEHLVNFASLAMENYRAELLQLQGLSEQHDNVVSIMGAGSLVTHFLPRMLGTFREQNTDVRYRLRFSGSNTVAKEVYDGSTSLGFIRGEPWTKCEKAVIRTEYAAVVSRDPVKMEMLPYLPRIDAALSESAKMFINNWWRDNYTISPTIAMIVPNIATCVQMVREGLGYSIIISSDVYEGIEGLNIYPLMDKKKKYVKRNDYMIWNKDYEKNSATLSFMEFAFDYFKSTQERMLPE
ncbi:MAG: LysR family transcriptional regulator [Spirochaetales bacterium]|nr:LysR family transcriptional regulator [Spirochaetales bacterium]